MSDYLDPNNEELLKDFFGEAQGQVDLLEQNILVLETDPHDKDAIDEIFRAAHTLKGGAATVQMLEISEFTHLVEDVLDDLRSGKIQITEELTDALLQAIDTIKSMLEHRLNGKIFNKSIDSLKSLLSGFLNKKSSDKSSKTEKKTQPVSSTATKKSTAGLSEYDLLELKQAAEGQPIHRVAVKFDESNPMNSVGGIQVFAILKELGSVLKTIPDFDKLYEDTFWPVVEYFVVLKQDVSLVQKKCSIADVTTGVEIDLLVDEATSVNTATTTEKDENKTQETGSQATAKQTLSSLKSDLDETEASEAEAPAQVADTKKSLNTSSGSILRVDSKRIDNLLNLVSETVINKATFGQIGNQFTESVSGLQDAAVVFKNQVKLLLESFPEYLKSLQNGVAIQEIKKELLEKYAGLMTLFDPIEGNLKGTVAVFKSTSQNLGRIIGELHEGVLRIRMVPISQIFSRFPRLVRDLSKTLNKKVDLIIDGEETELDKSVIEDLLDPLIHCVRNSIDHGIEYSEMRKERGKPEAGKVILAARNEGNMIIIEISDDGNGIDVDAVKKKAVERGLVHPNKMLSDIEAFSLIFEPGFSTSATVTNISGRGVGLDVVRKQIEKLNGNVSIWSEKEVGSKFTIKLPLTLAIIQGLLVRVGSEVYAIPITSVIDSHRIRPSEVKIIDGYEVFNVRKDVVSLMRLSRLFGIEASESTNYLYVVVVGSGDKRMGLVVDALIGEEDVVIKPLKDQYTTTPGIAGATILGDGKVSLIVDVSQLLELGLKNERTERQRRESLSK
jgi:two-component system chemotaxis sensor kinase CheA